MENCLNESKNRKFGADRGQQTHSDVDRCLGVQGQGYLDVRKADGEIERDIQKVSKKRTLKERKNHKRIREQFLSVGMCHRIESDANTIENKLGIGN